VIPRDSLNLKAKCYISKKIFLVQKYYGIFFHRSPNMTGDHNFDKNNKAKTWN